MRKHCRLGPPSTIVSLEDFTQILYIVVISNHVDDNIHEINMSELDVATAEKLYNIMMQVVEKATVEHKECQAARDRFLHDGDIAIIFDEFAAEMQVR